MSLPDSETVCFDNPDTAPEVIELRDKITDFEQLVEKYPTAQEIKQTLQTARKELKILLDQFGHLNFDKASAQDIIRHPNVRQLAFWFALTQEERKIVYDKLVKTGTGSGWDCNYSPSPYLIVLFQVIPMASEVTCQLLENASARF